MTVAEEEPLQLLWGDVGLLYSAQVEFLKVRDQLTLIFRMVVQMVDKAHDFFLEGIKLNL